MNLQSSASLSEKYGLLSSKTVNARGDDQKIYLQPLPYTQDALSPYISEETMQYHYGKHLATYLENTNKLKEGTPYDSMYIEEIILQSTGPLFNNAAQVFNHYFQFEGFQPYRKSEDFPVCNVKNAIEKEFGSTESFQKLFSEAALSLFGSGYIWLCKNSDHHLEIIQTTQAGNPLKEGKKPLLNLDMWEHAYYLDRQNRKTEYLENFWKIINWDVVERRFDQ